MESGMLFNILKTKPIFGDFVIWYRFEMLFDAGLSIFWCRFDILDFCAALIWIIVQWELFSHEKGQASHRSHNTFDIMYKRMIAIQWLPCNIFVDGNLYVHVFTVYDTTTNSIMEKKGKLKLICEWCCFEFFFFANTTKGTIQHHNKGRLLEHLGRNAFFYKLKLMSLLIPNCMYIYI